MTIERSIDQLPRTSEYDGAPPSTNDFFVKTVAEAWYESSHADEARQKLEHAVPEAGPYRASYATMRCDRALWYSMAGIERADIDLTQAWRFGLGHLIHSIAQEIATEQYSDAESEVAIDLRSIKLPGSAHADLIVEYESAKGPQRILVEMKTVTGFPFKLKATRFKGPPQGPDLGHILQAGLAALAAGCDGIAIVYFALEPLSVQLKSRYADTELGRFAVQWNYSIDEIRPFLDKEIERVQRVEAEVEQGTPSPRRFNELGVPDTAVFTDPKNGLWVAVEGPGSKVITDTGDHWSCNYCDFREKCLEDGA